MNNRTQVSYAEGSLAPLQFEAKARYDAPADKLFAMVSEPAGLHKWLAMLRTVDMDHSSSIRSARCDAGSVRSCSFNMMGEVDEKILWWNPPHDYGFGFAPKGRMKLMLPTKDHVNAFIVDSDGNGGSIFTWRMYFNWRGAFMRHAAVHMMPMMLNMSLENLRRELGGKGGSFRRIS